MSRRFEERWGLQRSSRRGFLRMTSVPLGSLVVSACGGGKATAIDELAAAAPSSASDLAEAPAPAPAPPLAPAPAPAPEPQPPVASGNREFALLSASGGTALPFTIGQAFRKGDVPSGSSVLSDVSNFQCVIKNRWPDGSAKFAVLSGRADLTANSWRTVKLTVGSTPAPGPAITLADLKAAGVSAAIRFDPFGTSTWSGADWDKPFQTWIEGSEMSAWTYRKPIGTDAHLVAWLEVRCYRNGVVEVLPWIENGFVRVASPGARTGTASFTLQGAERFQQPLALLNHQRTVLASGTTLTHWIGGDPQVTPRHDVAYLMSTRIVPHYRGATQARSSLFDRLPASFTPLAQASFPNGMGAGGYHPSIGLLPEWDVAYLTTGADARAFRGVVISGYAAGRYGIHFRDETTQRAPRFSAYPNLVLNGSSGVSGTGASSLNTETPAATGGSPPTYASTHHPSMGFMAYLLTGWYYFVEQAQFVAATNFLKQPDGIRQTTKGILETTTGSNTPRGAAWAIRSLAQAATITPDGDALRDEFVNSLNENIAYYHGRYVTTPNNPLGLVQTYSNYNGESDPLTAAVWMDDFFTAAFGYLKDLQVSGSAVDAKLGQFLTWKYRSIVGRLGGSGASEYSFRYAAQYTVNYAPKANSNWATGAGPWYASWGEVARSMNLPTTGNVGEPLESGYPTEASGYWGNLMPAIAYAVDHGATGAAEAWNRIVSASNFGVQAAAYDDSPVWGVKPR
jgi:hypothetical protein